MRHMTIGLIALMACFFTAEFAHAQGMIEYGQGLGGVRQRSGGVNLRGPSGGGRMMGSTGGLGDIGTRPVPAALVVESKEASLFARSEDWSDKVALLSHGEKLAPMAQTVGGSIVWYMVRTEKGAVGWIKSSDVSAQAQKKQ